MDRHGGDMATVPVGRGTPRFNNPGARKTAVLEEIALIDSALANEGCRARSLARSAVQTVSSRLL